MSATQIISPIGADLCKTCKTNQCAEECDECVDCITNHKDILLGCLTPFTCPSCKVKTSSLQGGLCERCDLIRQHRGESNVDHPTHYNSHPSGVECITVVEHFCFNIGNCIKYLWRAGLKGKFSDVEDLQKAKWYLDREINNRISKAEKATYAK